MLRRIVLVLLCLALVVSPAEATWSIIVVNRRTGEVAVSSATCIARINLGRRLATLVPGVGAGVVQASGDSADLLPLTFGLRQGLAPEDILLLVQAAEPAPRLLQTGIVSLYPGVPVTFSGRGVGRAKAGVAEEVGELSFAIQGNVLAGPEVVDAARTALLATPGDTGQKLLAAMQAARDLGGDGRCSCDFGRPDRCGAPPASFEKSAHVGFLFVSRLGDAVPPCVEPNGNDCAEGRIYMRLNVRGSNADENDPDPVDQLSDLYADWRSNRAGRPDGLLSTVDGVDSMPADGQTKRTVTVRLFDLEGVPLRSGGAKVQVASVDGARLNASLGSVVDLGDGSYRFSIQAGTRVGTDRLVITAEDDLIKATLTPFLEVRSEAPAALHSGVSRLSASRGGQVPFVLSRPDLAGAGYLLLASASGTEPGTPLGKAGVLPLVRDAWFEQSARLAGRPGVLPGTMGVLDGSGRAEAALLAPPGALLAMIGKRFHWAAVLSDGAKATTTDAVSFLVVP